MNKKEQDDDLDFQDIVGLPLQSKKFLAYLISEIGWKITLFFLLYKAGDKIDTYNMTLMVTIVITSGFIQIGYILGQVALDKYIKLGNKSE